MRWAKRRDLLDTHSSDNVVGARYGMAEGGGRYFRKRIEVVGWRREKDGSAVK